MTTHVSKALRSLPKASLYELSQGAAPRLFSLIDWNGGEDELKRSILRLLETLPPSDSRGLLHCLERVHSLANEEGRLAALMAAGDRRSDVNAIFGDLGSDYERAAWLFTNNVEMFCQAEQIKFANDHREGRSWDGYLGPANVEPDVSAITVERFKARISEIFARQIGIRGDALIDFLGQRPISGSSAGERLFQATIYVEDLPRSNLTIDQGRIDRVTMRPALEAAVTYCRESGEIEVIAKGGRTVRDRLAAGFAEVILGGDEGLEKIPLRRVDLSALSRPFVPSIDPADGIASVHLSKLRLRRLGSRTSRCEILKPNASDGSPYEQCREFFGTTRLDQTSWVPDGARLTFELYPSSGNARKRKLHVDLSEPNRCSLKEKTEAERLIGEKYLRRWGLVSDVAH